MLCKVAVGEQTWCGNAGRPREGKGVVGCSTVCRELTDCFHVGMAVWIGDEVECMTMEWGNVRDRWIYADAALLRKMLRNCQ